MKNTTHLTFQNICFKQSFLVAIVREIFFSVYTKSPRSEALTLKKWRISRKNPVSRPCDIGRILPVFNLWSELTITQTGLFLLNDLAGEFMCQKLTSEKQVSSPYVVLRNKPDFALLGPVKCAFYSKRQKRSFQMNEVKKICGKVQ